MDKHKLRLDLARIEGKQTSPRREINRLIRQWALKKMLPPGYAYHDFYDGFGVWPLDCTGENALDYLAESNRLDAFLRYCRWRCQ